MVLCNRDNGAPRGHAGVCPDTLPWPGGRTRACSSITQAHHTVALERQAWHGASDPVRWPLPLSKRLLNLPLSECILGTEGRGQINSTCRWMYWDTYSNGGHRQQSNTTKDALKIGKGCENSQMGIGWEGVVNERSCPQAKIWMIQRSRPELGMVISQVSRASTAKVLRQEQSWHLSLWLCSSE